MPERGDRVRGRYGVEYQASSTNEQVNYACSVAGFPDVLHRREA
jgi:hypothetical protein